MKLKIGLALCMVANLSAAGPCNFAPSKLVGGGKTAAVVATTGTTAIAGTGLQVAGIYAITNATTGAAMLGSTAAGASAAGTVGIISGTSGAIGAVGAALLSPFVIIPAAVVAVGLAGYEGACYLAR